MFYTTICAGLFVKRPNRFIAIVLIEGVECTVHVRNTGRCKELLLPGSRVILERSNRLERKTLYSLIAVYKGDRLINIDSLAPNQVVFESLLLEAIRPIGKVTAAKREVTYGHSRFDIYFETPCSRGFIEVKGVTLEHDGVAMFPDAPTSRGTKHLTELTRAAGEGYAAYIVFLIQMKGVYEFTPNSFTDPAFAQALRLAANQGVTVLTYDCVVEPGGLQLGDEIKIVL